MKPLTDMYEEVVGLGNLFRAAKATLARGRRYYGEGADFQFELEREVFRLREQLARGSYRHGGYRLFRIWDPKPRVIAAAAFRDRVVHHAVHDAIEPRLDRFFIFDSYACRKGKGTHAALDRAHGFLRANPYALHLDVENYFQSIGHAKLKALARRHVADSRLLALLDMIIDSTAYLARNGYKGAPKKRVSKIVGEGVQLSLFGDEPTVVSDGRVKGLPLGNLTSQFFANLYLNELDQYVKHELKARYYLRYMDDMLLFGKEKDRLREWETAMRTFASESLGLTLHPGGGPVPANRGIGFLGFRLFPNRRKLKRAGVSRFIRRMNDCTERYSVPGRKREDKAKILSEAQTLARGFNAHAAHGNTYRIRKTLYDRFPIVNQYRLAGMRPRHERNVLAAHC